MIPSIYPHEQARQKTAKNLIHDMKQQSGADSITGKRRLCASKLQKLRHEAHLSGKAQTNRGSKVQADIKIYIYIVVGQQLNVSVD